MKLSALIEDLPIRIAGDAAEGIDAIEITGLAEDSRRVEAGDLFVARPGVATDGRRFVADAVARGAVAVLGLPPLPPLDGSAGLEAAAGPDAIAGLTATLAERLWRRPSEALALVGITGTNGKTTTAHLLHQVLGAAGERCGLMGSVHVDDGRGLRPAALTTPPAVEVSRDLRRMVDAGCTRCAMEVSSHALEQGRVAGLHFAGAVFTNLTGDHLDYHGSMEAYGAAKAALFAMLPADGFAIVNLDDPAHPAMIDACRGEVLTTSIDAPGAGARARLDGVGIHGTTATMTGPWGRFSVRLPLPGRHNVSNALQAAAAAWRLGVEPEAIARGLEACAAPPGRLEPVTPADAPFSVLVDFAHTDDALRNVLAALRPLVAEGGRLRVIFGCGGDRDRTKRPRMARAAADLADDVIVTSDNPRTEDPDAIIDEVMTGFDARGGPTVVREVDRTEAIRLGVRRCAPGDVLLIAGKGHETEQIIGARRRPFDDRLVARSALDSITRQVGAS